HRLVLQERRLAGAGLLEGRPDRRPGGRPALAIVAAERAGMLLAAHVRIPRVPDLDALRAPDQVDRERGREAERDRRLQALGPRLDRAERRPRPVAGADQLDDLAAADEPVGTRGWARSIGRVQRSTVLRGARARSTFDGTARVGA